MARILLCCFAALFIFTVYAGILPVGDPPPAASNAEKIAAYYEKNKGDSLPSKIHGIESAGTLDHAKLLPFSSGNFRYFDTMSYLEGRAFMSDKMQQTLLASYKELEVTAPGRIFTYMESGLQNGGLIPGHRTHQCGLSVDLMVPLVKDGQPYYKLDTIGGWHYGLDFDNQGRYTKDSTVSIDFNLLALQVLSLDKQARKQGMHVKKVILKLELKDDFYATVNGKSVRKKGIYLAMNLPENVNKQHDDHFHVDFELLAK
jgi:penicillin-insensitive murein endopeptidase